MSNIPYLRQYLRRETCLQNLSFSVKVRYRLLCILLFFGGNMGHRAFVVMLSVTAILLLCPFTMDTCAGQSDKSLDESSNTSPLYLLTYDHGGLVLWGGDHFVQYLRSAVEWMDRYPSFKIGLDNEAYTYDQMARANPEILQEIRKYQIGRAHV